METGANQRPSNVIYDRSGSTVSITGKEHYDWKEIFNNAGWFHISGITPAISGQAADAALASVKQAKVAITLRESISATHNNWGALLYDVNTDSAHFSPTINDEYIPYEIRNIVDRVGGGDSFSAGLIYALHCSAYNDKDAIAFAVAASCLAHSIKRDINYSNKEEVERLMHGAASGRVIR